MAQRTGHGLRILVLTPQLPYPPHQGTSLRNYNLLRYLAQDAGHQVSLLSFAEPGSTQADVAHLRGFCRSVEAVPAPRRTMAQRLRTLITSTQPDMAWRLASAELARALASQLSREPFDVVQFEGIEMARYLVVLQGDSDMQDRPKRRHHTCQDHHDAALRQVREGKGAAPLTVFDDHNAEYLLQQRAFLADLRRTRRWPAGGYSLIQWRRLRRFERWACRLADRVVAVSEADAEALRTLDPALQPLVVPNGVDLGAYRPGLPPLPGLAHPCLVFTGKMDFRPNIDAVLWFSRHVLPLVWAQYPAAQFYVVGKSPSPRLDALRGESRITITGQVPETQPYIAGADAYVVPLLVGGGTRLKVLEAMAMGQALVSTRLGAEGLGVRHGEELLLADTPEDFAAQVVALLGDEARRRELGRRARAFVERSYGWRQIGPRLEAAYSTP